MKWNDTNATIPDNENFQVDVDWDRLVDIYIFTAIIVATILITLSRSFIFFSVCTYQIWTECQVNYLKIKFV